jgi:C-terminal processing protease CtpA/Prc
MIKHISSGRYAALAIIVLALGFTACKKNKVEPTPDRKTQTSDPATGNSQQTPTTDRVQLTNDSIFLYAKEVYYWNEALPTYDEYLPRKYTSGSTDLDKYKNNLFNIGRISGSADYTQGYSSLKYSFIEDATNANPQGIAPAHLASVDSEGNGNDVGIRIDAYRTDPENPLTYSLIVTAVYPGSPAATAGVKRGWVIRTINGQSFGANINTEYNTAINAMEGQNVSITGTVFTGGVKGADFSIPLTKASYKSSPIYNAVTLTAGTKKIGYLAFARFSTLDNTTKADLDAAFADFSAKGVKDLVIDLRYNGGGYINTAEYLINLIAPSGLNGKVMFREYYNNTMRSGKAGILLNQPVYDINDNLIYDRTLGRNLTQADDDYSPEAQYVSFNKKGSLGSVSNVIFIVSDRTASASELVINSLKPFVNVKLVGETTYGKPVGFFPIRIDKRWDVFYAMFETKNSNGEGGYFNGMVPDYDAATSTEATFFDNPLYEFGDVKEGYLAKAVAIIPGTAGSSTLASAKSARMSVREESNTTTAVPPMILVSKERTTEFIGMIKTPVKRR